MRSFVTMKLQATILAVLAVLGKSAVAIMTSKTGATSLDSTDYLAELVSLEVNALQDAVLTYL